MLHNELFVELSDEQQELVSGGSLQTYLTTPKKGYGPGFDKLSIAAFKQQHKASALNLTGVNNATATPYGASAGQANHLSIQKVNSKIFSLGVGYDSFRLPKGGSY